MKTSFLALALSDFVKIADTSTAIPMARETLPPWA
jgi:hypothetical protein